MTDTVEDSVQATIAKTLNKALKDSAPKFDNLMRVEFTYREGGAWHTVELSCNDFLKILQSGEYEDRKICAVSVCELNVENADETEDKTRFIYDFVRLHSEHNPWRMA